MVRADFYCPHCDRQVELQYPINEPPQQPPCATCQTAMQRRYQPTPFHLKGPGWTPKENPS